MKNIFKKSIAAILILSGLLVRTGLVFADANDPIMNFRNGDDTADTSSHIIGVNTSYFAVYGDRLNAPGVSSAFYFSQWFNIQATSGVRGTSNYVIDLDLGAYNPTDIGNLGDLLDAKVPTTRTVNGHALTSNVTVTKSDVSLGNVDNTSDANKPISTATQTALDAKGKAYEGTTARTNSISYFNHATVASGVAVFQLTADGLSTGIAIFPNGVIQDSVQLIVSDATASYQMSYAFTNSNKTLTVTANKLTTSNILTGVLGQATANGSIIKVTVFGY